MAYKTKDKSAAVELAKVRLTGMKQIDAARGKVIDYGVEGDPITSATLDAKIKAAEADISDYNGLLTRADALKNSIEAAEALLEDQCTRVLASGRGKFGTNSSELEQLGGKRASERAKPVRKTAPAK